MQKNEQNLLPPVDLEAEIERLQEELIDERDRNLRSLADFKNYRRRIERDGNKMVEEEKRKMMLPLLDIIDDLEKALHSAHDTKKPFVKGVQIIHQKLVNLLDIYGVLPFESVGMQFNPNLHEAVAMVKHKGSEPGIIIDELRRGYHMDDELLRTAQVRVAAE